MASSIEWHGGGIWSKRNERRSKQKGREVRMYYVRVFWKGKAYSEKAGTTRLQANKLLGTLTAEIDGGTYLPPAERNRIEQEQRDQAERSKAERLTFAEFGQRYLEANRHRWKRDTWHRDMVRMFSRELGECLLVDLDRMRIEDYLAKRRRRKLSPSTVNSELRKLRTMLYVAVEWKLIPENPAAKIKPALENQTEARSLDADEREKLLAAADPEIRPAIKFALLTGMRWGEVAALTWGAVDLEKGAARLGAAQTKTNRARTVTLNPDARAVLAALPTRFQGGEARVFQVPLRPGGKAPKVGAEQWSPLISYGKRRVDHYRPYWERAVKAAGIDWATPHATRHTFASGYLMRGGTVPDLCKLCGWSDWKMIEQRYSHFTKDYLQEAVSIMNGFAG